MTVTAGKLQNLGRREAACLETILSHAFENKASIARTLHRCHEAGFTDVDGHWIVSDRADRRYVQAERDLLLAAQLNPERAPSPFTWWHLTLAVAAGVLIGVGYAL